MATTYNSGRTNPGSLGSLGMRQTSQRSPSKRKGRASTIERPRQEIWIPSGGAAYWSQSGYNPLEQNSSSFGQGFYEWLTPEKAAEIGRLDDIADYGKWYREVYQAAMDAGDPNVAEQEIPGYFGDNSWGSMSPEDQQAWKNSLGGGEDTSVSDFDSWAEATFGPGGPGDTSELAALVAEQSRQIEDLKSGMGNNSEMMPLLMALMSNNQQGEPAQPSYSFGPVYGANPWRS